MNEEIGICTLRVLHLPPQMTDERREELFKNYGAVKTRTVRKSKKYTITFVEFPNKSLADDTIKKLHQLPVQGHRLSIEFAKRNVSDSNRENSTEYLDPKAAEKETEMKANYKAFLKKLNSWLPYEMFVQPISPTLRYKYPAPTRTTLLKIAIQLIEVPAFYTQVLHLMNKMNLPPPFDGLNEEYPEIEEMYDLEKYKDLFGISKDMFENDEEIQEVEMEEDDEESELETDNENGMVPQIIIPEKRKMRQTKKRLKIPKFVNPLKQHFSKTTTPKQRAQDVFETLIPHSRKIMVKPLESASKLSETINKDEEKQSFVVEPKGNVEGFGLLFPASKDDEDTVKEEAEKSEFISTEQLHSNRISTHDQRLLPVFKNYHPGKSSNRLYLKNLSKQVEESDLHFIYRRYVLPNTTENETEYNVRLMKEGRMKGQAFITLPNIAQTQLALNETNGYILKDKPMVVQFAKVSKR